MRGSLSAECTTDLCTWSACTRYPIVTDERLLEMAGFHVKRNPDHAVKIYVAPDADADSTKGESCLAA